MSADLLAEFDSFYQKPSAQQQQQQQIQQPASSNGQPHQSQQSATSSSDPFSFSSFGSTQLGQTSQPQQPWGTTAQTTASGGDAWGDLAAFSGPATTSQPSQTADDDDGWGDFETAAAEAPKSSWGAPAQQSKPPMSSERPFKGHRLRASTLDLMTNNLVDIASYAQSQEQQATSTSNITKAAPQDTRPSPPKQPKQSDPNVLFDAEDYDGAEGDDDDFGDFETGDSFADPWPQQPSAKATQPAQTTQQAKPLQSLSRAPAPLSLDLLSLNESFSPPATQTSTHGSTLSVTSVTSPYPQAPKSPSFMERNPFPGLAVMTPTSPTFPVSDNKDKTHSPTPVTAWPTFEGGGSAKPGKDDWSPFEDFPPEQAQKKPAEKAKPVKAAPAAPAKKPAPKPVDTEDSWDWDAVDTPQPAAAPKSTGPAVSSGVLDNQGPDSAPPPTNIPPPSVLLSIFPQLLNLADTSLYKPLAGQSQSLKDRVSSDPATVTFLRAYLLLATVAARIIAGRKLRWHRDKFLSQGMAISAAGAKGMKLAGVDRTQAAREDREAADVAGVWREHVGRLRSAVAAANAARQGGQPQLRVPDVAENLPVTTAKVVPTAPKACVVCGLKRDERVTKVDFEVEDSFGEWWVEHWGHRACKNFWGEHEKQLRSR